jgi:sugar phosphate isomerase/epimerase
MNFPIRPLIDEIEELGHLGFDYVEISMDPPEALPKKVRQFQDEIAKALRDHGMGLIAHMPTFVSIADLYESLRLASVEETLAALETASELGAEKIVLHPPFPQGLGRFVARKAEEEGLLSLGEIIEKARVLGMTVCLENMFAAAGAFTRPDAFMALLNAYSDLRVTLDIGHAFLSGGLDNILEFIRVLGNRIAHVHVNDNFGTEDSHLPIGAGIIDYRLVLEELRLSGYDETMTVEVFSRDRAYLKMSRDRLASFWEETT